MIFWSKKSKHNIKQELRHAAFKTYHLCPHLVRSRFGPDSGDDPFDSQASFHHLISKVEQVLQIIIRVVIKNLIKQGHFKPPTNFIAPMVANKL